MPSLSTLLSLSTLKNGKLMLTSTEADKTQEAAHPIDVDDEEKLGL